MRMIFVILATTASAVLASIPGQAPRSAELDVAIHQVASPERASLPVDAGRAVAERPEADSRAVPGGGAVARLLTAGGFLTLIAGLLLHWSSDASCREKTSVFSP